MNFQVEALLSAIEQVRAEMCARAQQHAENQRRYMRKGRVGCCWRARMPLTIGRGRLEQSELRFAELQRTRMLQLDAQISNSIGEGLYSQKSFT